MVGRSWAISNSGVAQFSFLLEIGCWAGVCDSVEMQKRNEKYIYIKGKRWEREKAKKGKRKKKRRMDKNKRNSIEESGLILRANSSETLFFRIEGHNDVLVGYSRTSLVIFDEP